MPLSRAPLRPERGDGARGRRDRPDMRLSRSQRLMDSCLFRETFDQGRRYPGSYMVLWLRQGDGAALRLGVVTSRRSLARAVDRAMARRRMREAFRRNRFRLRGAADLILVARTRILDASSRAVEDELLKLTARAGLLQTAG